MPGKSPEIVDLVDYEAHGLCSPIRQRNHSIIIRPFVNHVRQNTQHDCGDQCTSSSIDKSPASMAVSLRVKIA